CAPPFPAALPAAGPQMLEAPAAADTCFSYGEPQRFAPGDSWFVKQAFVTVRQEQALTQFLQQRDLALLGRFYAEALVDSVMA
ncbi:hypothetical protein QU989_25975, partial [Klebsiella pneumoniae]|nr:hypothetical protein [Klebsiella pneumoniae]